MSDHAELKFNETAEKVGVFNAVSADRASWNDQKIFNTSKAEIAESVAKSPAIEMLNGFTIWLKEQLAGPQSCTEGWASTYPHDNKKTADLTVYGANMHGVAVDMKHPVNNSRLGETLEITNLRNHKTSIERVKDYGAFGNPHIYKTPDGKPRLIDLTEATAGNLAAGDLTPVRVCTHR